MNGVYRAYARGRRCFTAAAFGAWASLDFTVNIAAPEPAGRERRERRRRAARHGHRDAGCDGRRQLRSSASSAAPTAARAGNASAAACAPPGLSLPLTVQDYEAERGRALTYRASVEATISGQQLVSSWTTAAVSGVLPAAGWNLKVPLDPSQNLLGAECRRRPRVDAGRGRGHLPPSGAPAPGRRQHEPRRRRRLAGGGHQHE